MLWTAVLDWDSKRVYVYKLTSKWEPARGSSSFRRRAQDRIHLVWYIRLAESIQYKRALCTAKVYVLVYAGDRGEMGRQTGIEEEGAKREPSGSETSRGKEEKAKETTIWLCICSYRLCFLNGLYMPVYASYRLEILKVKDVYNIVWSFISSLIFKNNY